MIIYFYVFLGLHPSMSSLLQLGLQKTRMAFRPSTQSQYNSMFRLFLAFLIFMNIHISKVSSLTIIAYLQFLDSNHISSNAMANHLSAIKAKMSIFGLSTSCFKDPRINYFQKSVTLHRPFKASLKTVIDIDTLHLIVRACDFTYMGQIFKAIYTLAFFSFLRLSNLVPHTRNAFSPYYQLARGDVIFAPPGLLLLIKWSKTIQAKNAVKILKIPDLGANPICPVHAIRNAMSITPGANNSPLFQYKSNSQWQPLTDSQVRRHFALILKKLNLHNSNITFHAFRRSGATYAFNSNVELQHIQSHGTWTWECVWKYITTDHDATDQVALSLQCQLHLPTS